MNTVFIHCGAPKTGTSYLQVMFAKYSDRLAEAGIIYPEISSLDEARAGGVTSGNGVEMANYLRPNLPHNIQDKDAFLSTLGRILEDNRGKDVLFSSEFIVFPNGERSENVARIIRENGYGVKLVYFVRDIACAARSTYSQQVKRHGEARPFSEFLKTWDPHYLHHVQLMNETFGGDSLILLNYDSLRQDLADFFFKEILGVDFPVEGGFSTNRSLGNKELELCRLMNETFSGQQGHLSTFVSDALMGIRKDVGDFDVETTEEEFLLLKEKFSGALDFLNRHIQGERIRITPKLVKHRDEIQIGDFEAAVMVILARLIERSFKGS